MAYRGAEPALGLGVGPSVVVDKGEESGVSKVEPQDVQSLSGVYIVAESAEVVKALCYEGVESAVAGGGQSESFRGGGVVGSGTDHQAHNVAVVFTHRAGGCGEDAPDFRWFVEVLDPRAGF